MTEIAIRTRGNQFQVSPEGTILNTAANVEALRKLWLDRTWVTGETLGPGDPGDFAYGAWHVACHLAAAAGVRRASDGRLLWLEVSHRPEWDEYFASVTGKCTLGMETVPIDSAEGRMLLADSTLLGYVEGNSTGRTSARLVMDPPTVFNLWRRQDFDRPVGSADDGGKVWEHWCTLRDIRETSRIGTSVLTAYISLVAALGGRFVAAVARGRRDYGHPEQLCAMVHAGLLLDEEAVWDVKPMAIPPNLEAGLLAADPGRALQACELLDWADPPRYYMFQRRIDRWSPSNDVQRNLAKYRSSALP